MIPIYNRGWFIKEGISTQLKNKINNFDNQNNLRSPLTHESLKFKIKIKEIKPN